MMLMVASWWPRFLLKPSDVLARLLAYKVLAGLLAYKYCIGFWQLRCT